MLFRDVVSLLVMEEASNANGFPQLSVVTQREVFANKKSVRSNEFYLASQSGFSLELMFEIRTSDYKSEEYLDFEEKRYEIVRTFDRGEWTELICQAYEDKPQS